MRIRHSQQMTNASNAAITLYRAFDDAG